MIPHPPRGGAQWFSWRAVFLAAASAALVSAQGLEYVKAHYTKFEFRIPMRDGKRLFTSVYAPKDLKEEDPILLLRTPYSVAPYGPDKYRPALGPSEECAREGFIFAYQDVRGRNMSEGTFVEMTPHKPSKSGPADVDESTDTWDTIDWLVKNVANNNGKVGTWGVSYPGFYAAAGMIDAHPAHKAASPQAPVTDLYMGDDAYHNGAFMLAANFRFYTAFKPQAEPALPDPRAWRFDAGTPDGYEFFLNLMGPMSLVNEKWFKSASRYWLAQIENTTYNGFWKARDISAHMKAIRPAVMTVGGWFDAEDLAGPMKLHRKVQEGGPVSENLLVMGPWSHGAWARDKGDRLGKVEFNANTGEYYRAEIEYPFFLWHLKGKLPPGVKERRPAKATVFESGTNRWRLFDAWPPKEAVPASYHFRAGGRLSGEAPDEESAFDEYWSDPNRPVPFIGFTALGVPREYMVEDQRFAATRPDILVYQTPVLEDDVCIAGPVGVRLHVSTTGTDSDFVVKLIDVYPDDYPNPDPNPLEICMGGYQQLVRGEPFRGKFRNSFEKPEPFTPGQVEKIEFRLPDIAHSFRRGHRIMVQVHSSWFPLVDRNPQKFMEIPTAREGDFVKAKQQVWRSRTRASAVTLPVLR